MSDTPRTDAHHWEAGRNLHPFQYAPLLSFARELERELKDAQEAYLKSVERDDYLTQGLAASKAEVARLRELLNRAIELAEKLEKEGLSASQLIDLHYEIDAVKELARLAPAPEEAVKPTCANTTHKFSHCDCEKPIPIEPAPEWRELGPGEEIHTGDQVQAKHHDKINGEWQAAWSFEIGVKAGHFKAMRYRTRRPLPKQEMPLERELKRIVWYQNYSEATIYHTLADAIRYLRDEIEQLKKNQK